MAERKKFNSNQWWILGTLMIASFLGRLDGTIVNLAIPSIIKDFGITVSQASWISTAYIISNAIFVPIFGKLGDMIGRKPLYLFGILGFTAPLTLLFGGIWYQGMKKELKKKGPIYNIMAITGLSISAFYSFLMLIWILIGK